MTWMTTKQLAAELAVSDRTIRYWAVRGMIPGAIRIGRQFRFRLTEIEAWLNKMDVSTEQGEFHQWPKFTSERDQKSTKADSKSTDKFSVDQLAADVQRLLNKRQIASKNS